MEQRIARVASPYKEYVTDALRCPVCKDVVCSHKDVGTEYHVPRCCGYVLTVCEEWDTEHHRWVVVVVAIPESEWDSIDSACLDV